MNWEPIAAAIAAHTGRPFQVKQAHSLGGGCINRAYRLEGAGQRYFIKLNRAALLPMFEAEAEGLRELAAAEALRVPLPLACGVVGGEADGEAWLALEYVDTEGATNAAAMARFGAQLAQLHRYTRSRFGWQRDNTIGATPQLNAWRADWIEFWREQRLGFQLQLARDKGIAARTFDRGRQLLENLGALFSGYQPVASVLHGDLWSGNYAFGRDGSAVIFDPAVYFGDRETDLAMTELFGGFSREFYAAYAQSWPLDPGYAVRKTLYNLYHILNHYNLFGGGYAQQAQGMIERLLGELG